MSSDMIPSTQIDNNSSIDGNHVSQFEFERIILSFQSRIFPMFSCMPNQK